MENFYSYAVVIQCDEPHPRMHLPSRAKKIAHIFNAVVVLMNRAVLRMECNLIHVKKRYAVRRDNTKHSVENGCCAVATKKIRVKLRRGCSC